LVHETDKNPESPTLSPVPEYQIAKRQKHQSLDLMRFEILRRFLKSHQKHQSLDFM